MSHFAKIKDGVVVNVLRIEQEQIDTGLFGDPESFVQTSYNTEAGVHKQGGAPLRKNYATIGGVYDKERDAFYEQQPFPSWVLNEDTCIWEAPVPYPVDDTVYMWDEDSRSWVVNQQYTDDPWSIAQQEAERMLDELIK